MASLDAFSHLSPQKSLFFRQNSWVFKSAENPLSRRISKAWILHQRTSYCSASPWNFDVPGIPCRVMQRAVSVITNEIHSWSECCCRCERFVIPRTSNNPIDITFPFLLKPFFLPLPQNFLNQLSTMTTWIFQAFVSVDVAKKQTCRYF